METTTEVKLNIGSNDFRYPGFLNLDIRDVPGVDIVDDVRTLSTVTDNSVDHMIAEAVLEHFNPDRTQDMLKLWVSKLKSGGKLEVMVPDGEMLMRRFFADCEKWSKLEAWEHWLHDLFGNIAYLRKWHGEDAERFGHHTLFCHEMLDEQMKNAGLVDITWKDARHGACMTSIGVKP
jgi:predicted SAM-dependent methyltransferase